MRAEILYKIDALNDDLANEIRGSMDNGGLCILPSDSSYILTGNLYKRGVSRDIDTLLKRNGKNMSLAFGSINQASEDIRLSEKAVSFVKMLSSQGLTFVALPRTRRDYQAFSRHYLYADGTVGIRLTRSSIEARIARFYPLPTTPIRDECNNEVGTADHAVEIVRRRMTESGINRPLSIIDGGSVQFLGELSTVVKEEQIDELSWRLLVLREKAIGYDEISRVAKLCGYLEIIKKDSQSR